MSQIQEALNALWEDVQRGRQDCGAEADAYERRTFVRTNFAFVEAYTHWLKNVVAERLVVQMEAQGTYNLHLIEPMLDERIELRRNGGHQLGSRRIPTQSLLAYVIRQFANMAEVEAPVVTGSGWEALQESWRLRDRLTHPKTGADVLVSMDDIMRLNDGIDWLRETVAMLFDEHAEVSTSRLRHSSEE